MKDQKLKDALTRIKDLNDQSDKLKISNTLLGSGNHNKEAKLKINAMIREIDQCIDQLKNHS